MTAQPRGTVTFLLTDIEGSTRSWETSPSAMRTALARGLSVDRDGTFLARFLGATLVRFAVLSWLAREWQGQQLHQYLGTFTATTTLGFVVSLLSELQPGAPVMGWAFVLLTGAFAAASSYITYRAG